MVASIAVEDDSGAVVLQLSSADSRLRHTEMRSARGDVIGYCEREEHERTGHIMTDHNGKYISRSI